MDKSFYEDKKQATTKCSSFVPKNPLSFSRGRPELPQLSSKHTLLDFVTPRSALLLERFAPNYDAWLTKRAPWDEEPEFQHAKEIIRAIVSTNDPAERLCAVTKRYKVIHLFTPED